MLRAVDLCCGAGGFTCGLARSGVEVVLGVDIDGEALEVYRANHAHRAVEQDLADVDATVEEIRKCGRVDIVAGSTPCQDFSLSGNMTERDRADLTTSFARVVAAVRPPFFLLENVPNIVNSNAFGALSDTLARCGYSMTVVQLNSKYCGTAQCRRRVLVCGTLGPSASAEALQAAVIAQQAAGKAAKPTTVRDVLGAACGDAIFFAPRNQFYAAVLSTDRPYPTLRSTRGKCVERPPKNYAPRYEDAAPIEEAFVLDVEAAAKLATFPAQYQWPCRRAQGGKFIGNCVPPAMIATLMECARSTGFFDAAPRGDDAPGCMILEPRRARKPPRSSIDWFRDGLAATETVGERVDPGPPRTMTYLVGTTPDGDARAADVLNWVPHPGWTVHFKERTSQSNRVDDMFVTVPGHDVPFRGKRQLVALGLLDADSKRPKPPPSP